MCAGREIPDPRTEGRSHTFRRPPSAWGPAGRRRGLARGTDTDAATYELSAVYGPPRPVLVLSVMGEVDRLSRDEFIRHIDYVEEATRGLHPLERFGCRVVSTAIVIDLARVTFLGAHAAHTLSRRVDAGGNPLRLVVRPGPVERALKVLALVERFDIYADRVDAIFPSQTL